jgi:methionine synthase II (cobalamin-independent)
VPEPPAQHLAEVARRLPAARLVLQLDEPALPAVLAGSIPTESGFGRIAAIDSAIVRDQLAAVIDHVDAPVVVHCCATAAPLTLFADAGASAVGVELSTGLDLDVLGTLVEADVALWLGVVPSLGPGVPPVVRQVLAPVREMWRQLSFAADRLPTAVSLTPACGLAGASEGWARTALRVVAQSARALAEAAAEDVLA